MAEVVKHDRCYIVLAVSRVSSFSKNASSPVVDRQGHSFCLFLSIIFEMAVEEAIFCKEAFTGQLNHIYILTFIYNSPTPVRTFRSLQQTSKEKPVTMSLHEFYAQLQVSTRTHAALLLTSALGFFFFARVVL